jgi:hypothetical protein
VRQRATGEGAKSGIERGTMDLFGALGREGLQVRQHCALSTWIRVQGASALSTLHVDFGQMGAGRGRRLYASENERVSPPSGLRLRSIHRKSEPLMSSAATALAPLGPSRLSARSRTSRGRPMCGGEEAAPRSTPPRSSNRSKKLDWALLGRGVITAA